MESLGTVKTGTFGVADLYTEQRKYDKDKSKYFIWRERGHASLVHVLITKLKKAEATDPEPKHFEDGYRTFEYLMAANASSSSGSLYDQFTFANADAAQMQAGDLLTVDATGVSGWINISTTGVITYGARSATVYTTMETVEVLSVGAAGGTNTVVTVRRGVGATTPTAPYMPVSGSKVWHQGEASEDGSGSRASFSQNPVVVNNYIQIFKVPYEITDITQAVDIFGENEWQRKARNARKDFARRLERGFINGHMDKKSGALSETVWYTGGADEWIPKDTDHQNDLGKPLTQTNLNSELATVFLTGSEEKLGLCGYGYLTKLGNAVADKLRYNDALSADLGLTVNSFTATGGGTVHFVPDYEMSKIGKDGECLFLDMAYFQYMYLKGMDIHIDKGKDGKGLQANDEDKTKHQIKGVIGLKRTFKDAHFKQYDLS
jgi:Family of unknown function (DUF5309)